MPDNSKIQIAGKEEETIHTKDFGLNMFFKMSPDLLCIISSEGYFMELNPAWEHVLGYTMDELFRRPFIDLLHPDDISHTMKEFEEVLSGKDVFGILNRYRCKDGSYKWLEWLGKGSEDGKASYCIARDITEKRKAQEIHNRSEDSFHHLFENIPMGVYRTTPDGHILMANRAACKMLGYDSYEEMARFNLEEEGFMPSYSRSHFRDQLEKEGEILGLESEWKLRDGTRIFVRESSKAIRDSDGQILYYEGTIEDLTENKRTNDVIRKLSRAVEQSPVSIIITDIEGRIEYANPKACQSSGYSSKELLGNNPRVLKSFETTTEEYEKLWKTISEGNEWRGVFHNRKKNGECYWESATISPVFGSTGKATNYVAVKEDITEKVMTEKALRESEEKYRAMVDELREINNTKDKLFSIIAHDLRGPIGSFNQVLVMITHGRTNDPDLKTNLLQELEKSSRNIFDLLENLLDWSRIQQGLKNIEPENFNLMGSVNENVELFLPVAGQKLINIKVEGDKCINVFADRNSISVVIRNLLANAIKFTPNHGEIIVRVADEDHNTTVSISDNGVGMKNEVVRNLFKPESGYTTSKGTNGEKGSGLGLVLCKDCIERNGGDISAESILGKGSRIMFRLPKVKMS
ncbi:MAG: PAS domain S-box protein [Bacteroidales bacterium]|nr:PAS domain S-box protein [Bacteroidales bacterium]